MLRSALVLLALLTTAVSASPGVAGVRVAEIYRQLVSAREIADRAAESKAAISQDPRFSALEQVRKELEALQSQLSAAQEFDRLTRERLQQQFIVKRDEEASLRREVQLYQADQMKRINARMVREMNEELERIRSTAAEIAAEKDYELLLDLTGKTNTSLPFVIYAKDPEDITGEVLSHFEIVEPAPTPEP